MNVMVVEDTAILRKVMRGMLKEFCGMAVENIFEAEDAKTAIEMYKRVYPDVVFLDITLPEMNGKKAIGELLLIDPDARIVMFTNSRSENDVLECISAGAKDYLTKPIQPERIKDSIKKVLAGTSVVLPDALKND